MAWEDEHLLVVDKPAGVVVHPSAGHASGTLVHGLLGHAAAGGEEPERPGIVHRLDRDTSGLLVVARSDEAHRRLQSLLRRRKLEREYLALVHGRPRSRSGTIEAPIGRDRHDPTRHSLDTAKPRDAVTHFEVCELLRAHALLRVRLEPVGLTRSGSTWRRSTCRSPATRSTESRDDLGLERQFLHAARLAFPHPFTDEPVEVESPLPGDLARPRSSAPAARGTSPLAGRLNQAMRAFAVLVVAIAAGALTEDAWATSCVPPRARFAGGDYEAREVSAGGAFSRPLSGSGAVFTEYDADEGCNARYVNAEVRALDDVSPSVAFLAEDGLVWVSGGRCDTRAILRCLRTPLRYRGRSSTRYVSTRPTPPAGSAADGSAGGASRSASSRATIRSSSVQVGDWQFVAEDVCRMASYLRSFAACLENPHVVALGPLPESGRAWWPFAVVAALGAGGLAGGALVVRRHW